MDSLNTETSKEISKFNQGLKLAILLAIFAFLIQISVNHHWMDDSFSIILSIILYQMAKRSLKRLYYSTWTFLILLEIVFIYHFFHHLELLNLPMLFAAIILGIGLYSLFSPIYFPRVPWWEYDFRYRSDLPITINQRYKGRLTDLRRFAGGMVSFEQFSINEIINIQIDSKEAPNNSPIKAKVLAKREILIGRGEIYGIKFILVNTNDKVFYLNLAKAWKKRHQLKWKEKIQLGKNKIGK